jgi:CBS domain containing-hemolysin-like protein
MLPKTLFRRHGETLAYQFGPFLLWSRRAFSVVGLVGAIRGMVALILRAASRRSGTGLGGTGQGGPVFAILAEGRASGALSENQRKMAERVVHIGRVHLRDVLVPLDEAAIVPETVTLEELRRLLAETNHPRFGVYRDRPENVVGVINVYDVLLDEQARPAREHVLPPVKLQEDLGVNEALVRLQRSHNVLGFVFSRDGRCVGLVSIKDLVSRIVGEVDEW